MPKVLLYWPSWNWSAFWPDWYWSWAASFAAPACVDAALPAALADIAAPPNAPAALTPAPIAMAVVVATLMLHPLSRKSKSRSIAHLSGHFRSLQMETGYEINMWDR